MSDDDLPGDRDELEARLQVLQSAAEGTLEKTESGFLMTHITLRPKVVVADAGRIERARRILEKAEKLCLISNSMKTRVELVPEVTAA